jgi:hypothetical protein
MITLRNCLCNVFGSSREHNLRVSTYDLVYRVRIVTGHKVNGLGLSETLPTSIFAGHQYPPLVQ